MERTLLPLSGLKAVYKISLSAGGFFADIFKQSIQSLMNGNNVSFVLNDLGTKFGTMAQLFFKSGFGGVRSADQLGKGMTNMPVYPLSLSSPGGIQTLVLCDPKEIGNVVTSLVKGPLGSGLSPDSVTKNLQNVCCNPLDGKGYIPGAEQVVKYLKNQGDSPTPQIGNIRGGIAEAIAGDTLRGKFGPDFKYPQPSDYTLSGSNVQIDLAGTAGQTHYAIPRIFWR